MFLPSVRFLTFDSRYCHQARNRSADRLRILSLSRLPDMLPSPTLTEGGDRQVTPDAELVLLVSRWRVRAQEILAQAETMSDAEARQTMQEIAAGYERLAQRVEQQTRRAEKT